MCDSLQHYVLFLHLFAYIFFLLFIGQHPYQNNQQQWTDYGHSPPQVIGSQTPSPAHTPTPVSNVALHSPSAVSGHPPQARTPTTTMSGQYPSHHGHHMGSSGQGHGMAWNHSNVSQTQGNSKLHFMNKSFL